MRPSVPVVLILTLLAQPASAQTFPTSDPVLQRIWTLGMEQSQVQSLAQALLDSIGPRLTGTAEQRNGNAWLRDRYASWGITAQDERVGTWRGWRRGYSHIDLIAPRVRTLEGMMLGYSPGTNERDLTAETIILPRFADSSAFVRWLPQARGKFVLLSGGQPTCRPRENWTARGTPESVARMVAERDSVTQDWRARVAATGYSLALGTGSLGVRMEAAGVAGMITSRPKDAWGTIEVFETYNTRAPAIGLSCEDYGLVYRLTEQGQHPVVRFNLDAELLGEQPIFNTIARIPGTEKPNEYVMLSAHFDSWDGSSGATDNGTGTLTMLEAMRILKQAYPNPKRTILVGHWTGEEEGLVGSRAYSEDHPEVVQGLQALFNQDNGTGRISSTSGSGLPNGAEHLSAWLAKLPQEFQSQIRFGGVGRPGGGGSDHASFVCHGAPAFGLGASNWDYGSYTWHTNRDTYDKVVFDDLKGNATITAMLAYLASEDPTMITRERADLSAPQVANAPGRGGRGGGSTTWPQCQQAPRSTNPRLR